MWIDETGFDPRYLLALLNAPQAARTQPRRGSCIQGKCTRDTPIQQLCDYCRKRYNHGCHDKKWYPTALDALMAVADMVTDGLAFPGEMHPYACRWGCGRSHVGHLVRWQEEAASRGVSLP